MKYFLLFSFIISQSSACECPSNEWFRFRNKCYLSEDSKIYSFQENVNFCESQNTTTVSIHSQGENDFITFKLKTANSYWLGIRQLDFESQTYVWLDGSFYNYSNWKIRDGKKRCPGAFLYLGELLDMANCSDKHKPLCQIDFESPFNKLLSQINHMNQDLKQMKAKKESSIQSMHLYWILGTILLSMFCVFILSMYKIFERIRWLTNEIKSSNVNILNEPKPLTDILNFKDEH